VPENDPGSAGGTGAGEAGQLGEGRPRVAGVVLAAGDSLRMGQPKALLAHADGRSFLRAACDALVGAGLSPVLAVLGRQHARLVRELPDGASAILNPAPERGQVSSLALGLGAASAAGCASAIVALVDQPDQPSAVLALLRAAAEREPGAVHAPTFRGEPGHPVAFPCSLAPQLAAAGPGEGASHVLERLGTSVRAHPVDSPGILRDLDTPEDLAAWRAEQAGRAGEPDDREPGASDG
jgi:molybdenum cofactor cytidylyltransferase